MGGRTVSLANQVKLLPEEIDIFRPIKKIDFDTVTLTITSSPESVCIVDLNLSTIPSSFKSLSLFILSSMDLHCLP